MKYAQNVALNNFHNFKKKITHLKGAKIGFITH